MNDTNAPEDPASHLWGENAAWLEDQLNGEAPHAPAWTPPSIFHGAGGTGADFTQAERQAKVARLINAYRVHGHLAAQIDPLGGSGVISDYPELDPGFYGLGAADLDQVVSTSPLHGMPPFATVRTILQRLRQSYCGTVGVEFMNMLDPTAKAWVQERFEATALEPLDREAQVRALEMLTRAEGLERFLQSRFTGAKRFSLEGAETLIPLIDLLISDAARRGVREVVIGMAHRGRLNVLVNVLGKPPGALLAEFAQLPDQAEEHEPDHSGDVKYHLGYSSDVVTADGHPVHLSLAFNPSHLEAVNPVVEGRVRAKMDRMGDTVGTSILPLLLHGDAAFAGQGLNQEVLNLSGLAGYRTGGTVHVVVNNQVGFTTSPHEARSTPYCTGVARMLGIPIFHVNGEDPETIARIVRLASEWRATFHRDVILDFICFRKWGHNETDEPSFTQPVMYRQIAEQPSAREAYAASLAARGVLPAEAATAMAERFHAELDAAMRAGKPKGKVASALQARWSAYVAGPPDVVDTTVTRTEAAHRLRQLNVVPPGFQVHPKLHRLFKLREEQAAGEKPLDWAAGELLAYATLAAKGTRVRLSGQDCKRGTFSHRHAVLFDHATGAEHAPLNRLEPGQGPVEVYNSLLSEQGVLGFEYGYSLDYPEALVIWEAQFGDFANGAQIIIDNFLVSAHTKWNRLSGLVLFLPHGYEGQGPEHSSARIERFLQMCAQGNIQCVNPTTPAQMFHLLRRQVLRKLRDPLVVFTPKSLLRLPEASSSLDELATGGFQPLIGDGAGRARVVLCSGKVYYDLRAERDRRGLDVALVRVEELYPFPLDAIRAELDRHPGAALVWCQEEPRNMGPWPFVALELMEAGLRVRYAGRAASASPATGYPKRHVAEQARLVAEALG